jgi:hypothetical protein
MNAVSTQQLVENYKLATMPSSISSHPSAGQSPHLLHIAVMVGLTTMQLMFGLGLATILSSKHSAFGIFYSHVQAQEDSHYQHGSSKYLKVHILVGTLHYVGTMCTNLGFAYGSASIVQVIKLLEPVETLLLTYAILGMVNPKRKFGSALLIVFGTMLLLTSKGTNKHVNTYTIIYSLLSGVSFSSRNVAQKVSNRTNNTTIVDAGFLGGVVAKGIQNFISITSYALIPAIISLVAVEIRGVEGIEGSIVLWLLIETKKPSFQAIVYHGLYNIASISVLAFVSAATHSLLNVGKRVFLVLTAALVFQESLGTFGVLGLLIAGIGGVFYSSDRCFTAAASAVAMRHRKKLWLMLIALGFATSSSILYFGSYLKSASIDLQKGKADASLALISEIPYPVVPREENRRLRSIVLLGPHDRYNFGDLLFSKVLSRLLEQRAGYDASRILFGGLVPMNMTRYGGPPQIFSMKQIQRMSQNDQLYGPYDIVYIGGEALGCSHSCGVGMLPTLELRQLAMKEKIYDCAYLVPKKLLLPKQPHSNQTNYAIVNSMGGSSIGPCKTAVASADFKGYRDNETLTPDSAVMTKELFHRDIDDISKVVSDELGSFFREAQVSGRRYIAVQHKQIGADTRALAQSLDLVSRHMNVPVIFFAAGTAPNHDNFTIYYEISSLMEERSFVYRSEHALKVVALISGAEAVLGTSLHVRIMAFIHFKPRITWCSGSNASRCVKVNETLPILAKYVGTSPEITQNETIAVYEKTVRQYVSFFDGWSSKLLQNNNP